MFCKFISCHYIPFATFPENVKVALIYSALTEDLLCAVVVQAYDVDVEKEYAIRGNSVVLKCKVPSFVGDFVTVTMWEDNEGNNFYPSNDYGTSFFWELNCVLEIFRCS